MTKLAGYGISKCLKRQQNQFFRNMNNLVLSEPIEINDISPLTLNTSHESMNLINLSKIESKSGLGCKIGGTRWDEKDRYIGNKGFQPAGTILHPRLFRRNMPKENYCLFSALQN